jgi:preprotein translocase subunit SecA
VDDPGFFILPDVGGHIAEIEKSGATAEEKASARMKCSATSAIKSERIHTVNQLIRAYASTRRTWSTW